MRMVKSIGQLPNMVYLLAYDRQSCLTYSIQASTARVRVSPRRCAARDRAPEADEECPIDDTRRGDLLPYRGEHDSARWQYIVRDGIHRWIRSPRDVVRLSNAVKFSWPALKGEIDPQDLLAIEGHGCFDVGAFNWIRDNRDFLFAEGRFMLAQDELKNAAAESVEEAHPENDQLEVLRIMSVLFPQSAKWFEGRDSFREDFDNVTMRRGVGSEAGYDAYFGMNPSSDAIPKTWSMILCRGRAMPMDSRRPSVPTSARKIVAAGR